MKTFNLDSETNSKIVASKDLKYTLAYFGIHFAGASARGILAYAGADWTPVYPNWGSEKSAQPFEVIPVLTIIDLKNDGHELVLAENVAIDIFLAKQFGLHGSNAWEEALINAFYSNSNTMFFQEIMNNFFWESSGKDEEEKAKYLETFLNDALTTWGRIHEAHLENNHGNGHYVGNRTTLADIRTTTMLDALEKIIGKDRVATIINETKTPNVIKVRENVEAKPSYQTWITSEEYQKLDVKSTALVKEHHPELVDSKP
ncbi:hypothetical protein BC939DRAFT_330308 [Gamsiella multidivaricata]|uniref:uncharacterized protein n=1 Tax=Gamsiella multidivaricata TaxID=101098 RepID=UPI00221F612B|nr:uncharacterized protein BC939DRAFT_330308 [Gamsiella multidivaricata]KAG0368803.1 hypothetical protein BGZ54_001118 [Gamsiella multidivaricata]KAI7817460.1 hypothetical protein BC939DRAFT_330308 [Gamsiella multidivaricata]